MSGPNDRITTAISTKELERRWAAARKEMRERGIDALVMQNNSDWLGGYVKWFTDIPATNGYPKTVVFHADEPMTMVEMGGFNTVRNLKGADPVHRGIGELLGSPSFLAVNYTDNYHADCIIPGLKKRGYGTIGLVGPGSLPHAFVMRLKEGLPGAQIRRRHRVHRPPQGDQERGRDRPDQAMLRDAGRDLRQGRGRPSNPACATSTSPALAEYKGRVLGSEQGIFLGSSAPVGQPARFAPRHFQGRTLQKGDHLVLLIENNGPGGYYAEIARTLVLGKASNELIDGFEAMREAQDYTLSLMKPGASCRDIANAHDDYMKQRGFELEIRLYAHSQGYDMVERPMLRADETMPLEENMNFAVHPGYNTSTMWTTICDNYMVEANGVGHCLHKTEKKIFEIN